MNEGIDFSKLQQLEQADYLIYKQVIQQFIEFKSKESWLVKSVKDFDTQKNALQALISHHQGSSSKSKPSHKHIAAKYLSEVKNKEKIFIKFEKALANLKKTEVHHKLQKAGKKYLIDFYHDEVEMNKYKYKVKEDMKQFSKALTQFDTQNSDSEGSLTKKKAIMEARELELEVGTKVAGEYNEYKNLEILLMTSIIQNISDDMSNLHNHLKAIESINTSEADKENSKEFLTDYASLENKIDQHKELIPQMK